MSKCSGAELGRWPIVDVPCSAPTVVSYLRNVLPLTSCIFIALQSFLFSHSYYRRHDVKLLFVVIIKRLRSTICLLPATVVFPFHIQRYTLHFPIGTLATWLPCQNAPLLKIWTSRHSKISGTSPSLGEVLRVSPPPSTSLVCFRERRQ